MAKKFKLAEKSVDITYVEFDSKGEGDEERSLVKFGLAGVMWNATEIEKLCGKGTHERWFVKDDSGALMPAFDDFPDLKFAHRFTESSVTLALGSVALTLPGAKIMNIRLQRQPGGMCWSELDVEAPSDIVEGVTDIGRFVGKGKKVRAQLGFGVKASPDKRQQNLPLNEGADDDDDDQDVKPKKNGNGKHPQVHA